MSDLKFIPPLDKGFIPPYLELQRLRQAAAASPGGTIALAWERENGAIARFDLPYPKDAENCPCLANIAERIAKFMLWEAGGWKLHVFAPASIADRLRDDYSANGRRSFDHTFFSEVYGQPVTVIPCASIDEVPAARDLEITLGGNLNGNRIGFDLGASDYKLTAMVEGEPVWSTEIRWDPVPQTSSAYHYEKLRDGLKLAAEHLPCGRIDGIGGSTAGVVVDNQLKVASLIRGVKDPADRQRAYSMFIRLREEFGVPLEVANDGDISALAGAMSLGVNGIIGMALGSSEAVGYLDKKGVLTGRLSELAFAPVDLNPAAATDEWSRDTGVGAMYFSQQAVNKLALAAGMTFPADMLLPERLKIVQAKMEEGDATTAKIYESIGIYLGYTIPWYAEFYDYGYLMLLGRVVSGKGGEIIVDKANEVLAAEFPETAAKIKLFMPDEKARRVGQSAAAASLPVVQ